MDDKAHYGELYGQAARAYACTATSADELAAWQAAFRPVLKQHLGLDTIAAGLAGHQPHAERLASEPQDGYLRESWRLWVEPTVALPFYLLKPAKIDRPRPLVLTPHGHSHPHIYAGIANNDGERAQIVEGQRDIAVQAVREGYIAIAPTTRGFGETRNAADIADDKTSSCRSQLLHGLLVGRTPIGERVWDISRLIDWALANQPVAASRIAITGNSGGGTTSLHAAACEERIAVAMPSCYFCTYVGSIGSIYHCDCNYIPGILQLGEMYDVAGLIAPRPLSVIAGRDDAIFPLEHVRAAFAEVQRIYGVAGAAADCNLHVGDGGHRYYSDGAWPFLRRYFGDA